MTSMPLPEDALPHRMPLLLLDAILEHDAQSLCAEVVVAPQRVFCDAGGAPGWLGLEWLAQAGGAWVGIQHRAEGRAIDIGFLTGTRRYVACDHFANGRYRVRVEVLVYDREAGIAVFDGAVFGADREQRLASAQVRLYQPPDPGLFIQRQREEFEL